MSLKNAQQRLAQIMGKDAISLEQKLPDHPYDRYVEHFGTHEAIQKKARQFESDKRLAATIEMGSNTRHEMVSSLSMMMYAKYGRQTFRLPPDLQRMFAHTSLGNITPDLIGDFPFPCYYLDLPDFNRQIWASPTGWHDIKGAFVIDYEDHSGHRCWICNVWGIENDRSTHLGDDAQFSFGFSHHEWRKSELDLEAYLNQRYEETLDEVRSFGMPDIARQNKSLHLVFRAAIHLGLYLQGDPELQEDIYGSKRGKLERALARKQNPTGKKAKRIKRKLERITTSKVTVVAPSMQVKSSESTSRVRTESDESAIKKQRHWVRGHWRNQPYGSRDNPDYKMIWIQPHLRGDENLGDVEKRTYEVE